MPTETAFAQQEPSAPGAVRRYARKSQAPQRRGLVDYDRDLSDEQRAVALCDPRPTLVVAGAGSGKTRALTYRVARLIESGAPPEKLLLLTFTNKAAREMMARVGQICRIETRRMWGGTFHHVAHGLLREHAARLGYADRFGLLDREDSKEEMASATADLGYGVGQRRFPRPDALIDLYSSAINTQRPLAEVIATEAPQFVALEEEILRVARRFAERKAQMNAMDFDDLLLNWKRLLVEVPAARESICRRFSAVLVDEYQDTNRLQGEIVDATAAPHGNVLVVGDDAQSIYAFRGAHFENILRFPEDHPLQRAPGEGPGVARRVPRLARRRTLSQRACAARTGWRRRGAAPVLRRGHACQGRAVPDGPCDAGGTPPGAAALASGPGPRRAARRPP